MQNIEACNSIKSVKYLYKYVYKGHDRANVEILEQVNYDEIKTYLDARYVSAPEADYLNFQCTHNRILFLDCLCICQ